LPFHDRIEKATRLQRALLCLVLGGIASLGMAPYNIWPILILSFSFFYILLDRTTSLKGAFCYSWLFGFGYFFTGLFWVKNALLVDGNPFSWVWPLAVMGLPSLLAFFTACAGLASKKLFNLRGAAGFLGFTALMATAEWARGFVFTGYPWNLFGMTWSATLPMVQNVAIGNIYFLTWLTIFWFALPGFCFLKTPSRQQKTSLGAFALVSFTLCLVFGVWRLATVEIQTVPDVKIHIVQPDISQSEKWDGSKIAQHFMKMVDLSRPDDDSGSGKTIIVWPETAMNYWIAEDPEAIRLLKDLLGSYEGEAVLLTGILRHDRAAKTYYNSLAMIDRDGNISNIYNKHHLVPFGEYIPFQKWIPLEPVVAFNGFVHGTGPRTLEALGVKYSPAICYEIIFSGKITAGDSPDLIVNVTNDAWYGISVGPYQHFAQAVFRAVEEGIPVARSANTGFSGMIDPLGRVHQKSQLFQEYEKTLALPAQNMIFRNQLRLKNVIFIGLVLLLMSYGYSQRKQ